MLVIAAVLLIALALSAYTVRTITADNRLPSQEFLASFATPRRRRTDWEDGSSWTLAQNVGQDLHAVAQDLLGQIDAALAPIRCTTKEDWKRYAEASVTHTPYVPTGAEFDAAEASSTPLYDRLLAAMGLDEVDILGPVDIAAMVDTNAPAKRRNVRVWALAQDCDVDSKFMRTVLEHQFGITTKSPSSTVTAQQADEVREFFYTHADV